MTLHPSGSREWSLAIPVLPAVLALLAGCTTAPVAPVRPETPPPRVMTMVTEKGAGTATSGAGIDSMALSLLIQRNVPTVDPAMVQSNLKKIQAALAQTGDEQGAIEVGLQCGADVILTGQAEAQCAANQIAGSNLKSYQGTVNLRAICTDDARVLAMASATARAIALEDVSGTSRSLQAASRQALDKLVPDMLLAWDRKQAVAATKPAATLSLSAARGSATAAPGRLSTARDRSLSTHTPGGRQFKLDPDHHGYALRHGTEEPVVPAGDAGGYGQDPRGAQTANERLVR